MKHLVLAGGGHAHIEVLRRFGVQRVTGHRLTVISPDRFSLYSGMLPGLIAGHYTWQQCHIDLGELCARAGAELVQAQVCSVDPETRTIALDNGCTLAWDLLSLNTGSAPALLAVPGAREHVVPIKPMSGFLRMWEALLRSMQESGGRPARITVVGGGAGGVEVVLAMNHRLQVQGIARSAISLVTSELLATHPRRVRHVVTHALEVARIDLLEGRRAVEVTPATLHFASGPALETTFTVWVTGAAAPSWLARSKLATDARGFLTVNGSLRSVSHPCVLGAGDVASLASRPVPKAGVYAVRQGPALAENLMRLLRDQQPIEYKPQRRFLSLLSLGERRAVASWGNWGMEGAWVWKLKDRIDRAFMRRYEFVESTR
jgi:selenide,water dikinase